MTRSPGARDEQWGFVGLKPSARPAASTSRHYLRRIER